MKNEFEPDGDLLSVTSKKAGTDVFRQYASNFSYTVSGGITQMRLGNGKWETAKFNTRLQVTELGLGSSAANAGSWRVNYEYGELSADGTTVNAAKNTGNIAKQTLTIPGATFVQNYRYDSLYRLKDAVEPGTGSTQNWTQVFDYDRYGNRTSFTQTVGGVTTHNTTPAISANSNRFTSTDFLYDKNGNVVVDFDPVSTQPRQFTFNADNRQIEVVENGVSVGQYFYDGEGKRVKKVVGNETTVFVYSAGKLVAEYSTTAPPAEGHINYTTTDHLGSPRIITNELGRVQSRRDFMPFGEDLASNVGNRSANTEYTTGDQVRQKFTGYQKDDETKLDFAEARMYENRFGRFTAIDPLLASGKNGSPQTFNRYVYVQNAPLIVVDPTGKFGEYYDRKGNYIGSDGIPDRLYWIADVARRDETNKVIYVENAQSTTLEQIEQLRGAPSSGAAASQATATFATSNLHFSTISQRAAFYAMFGNESSNGTRWPGAASRVASDIDSLGGGLAYYFGYSNDELIAFANRGNRTIFDDAFPKLAALKTAARYREKTHSNGTD